MPNRTFYFTQQNLDNLMSEEIPNKTLNMILSNYYVGRIALRTTQLDASPDKMQKFEELKTKFPPLQQPDITITPSLPNKEYFVGDFPSPHSIVAGQQTIAPPEYAA